MNRIFTPLHPSYCKCAECYYREQFFKTEPMVKLADVECLIIDAIELTEDSRFPMGYQDRIWNGIYKALDELRELAK